MRIVCPSCHAAYEVPEPLLSGPPRRVRCARCDTDWTPEPPAPIPAPKPEPPPPERPPPDPEPDPEPDLPPPPPVRPEPPPAILRTAAKLTPEAPPAASAGRASAILAALAWAASAAVLGAGLWAAFAWRGRIMELWAPSRRFFALFGLG